eukprot:scaffold30485_cov24-Tisochrysis_lutea.AAC.2
MHAYARLDKVVAHALAAEQLEPVAFACAQRHLARDAHAVDGFCRLGVGPGVSRLRTVVAAHEECVVAVDRRGEVAHQSHRVAIAQRTDRSQTVAQRGGPKEDLQPRAALGRSPRGHGGSHRRKADRAFERAGAQRRDGAWPAADADLERASVGAEALAHDSDDRATGERAASRRNGRDTRKQLKPADPARAWQGERAADIEALRGQGKGGVPFARSHAWWECADLAAEVAVGPAHGGEKGSGGAAGG